MELSVIITHYNNPELLKVCLDSVLKNTENLDAEIIVSDYQASEKTRMMMREDYPQVKFLTSQKNIGFGGLANKGIEITQGKYLLILNGDIIANKDSILKLLEFIKNHPEAGIVGPQLLNFNETMQPSCFRFYTPLTILYRRTFLGKLPFAKKHLDNFSMKDFNHESIREVDWLMGSAMMTSKESIEKVGLFDSRFKMYFEDTDWCRRFWESGLKVIYYPEAKMFHYHGKGSAGKNVLKSLLFNKLTWIHIISAVKFFAKYWGKPLPNNS